VRLALARMEEEGLVESAPQRYNRVTPLTAGDARASWNVTFGTEDADATAAKATELGGTVVVPPVDAPYSRFTVLRDPQGATFTASAFVPENKDVGRAA